MLLSFSHQRIPIHIRQRITLFFIYASVKGAIKGQKLKRLYKPISIRTPMKRMRPVYNPHFSRLFFVKNILNDWFC